MSRRDNAGLGERGRLLGRLLVATVMLCAWGCSSGGGSSDPAAPVATTEITGSIYAGPVSGAEVTVKTAAGETIAGPVVSSGDGTFEIEVPDEALADDLRFEASGGTFTDEAGGAAATCGTLSAFVEAGSLGDDSAVHLTPATTVAHALVVSGGMRPSEAAAAFEDAFGFPPDPSIAPVNEPPAGADASGALAAVRAGAFSQLASDLGLAPEGQFGLLGALAEDLEDGVLDGADEAEPATLPSGGAVPEDIQNRFELAFTGFLANANNHTGLTAEKVGALPFAKVALSDTYRVEYVPGAVPATAGRTEFELKVTRRSDGAPAAGLALALKPTMYMASHAHATPLDGVVDQGDGTYGAALYYLMSAASGGMSMGYWKLGVVLGGGEQVAFFPYVEEKTVGTLKAVLKGQADPAGQVDRTGPAGSPANRSYYLFPDGVRQGPGGETLELFVATKENMENFPALAEGLVLRDENGAPWTVETIEVLASTDGVNWVSATAGEAGHWSAAGLGGLTVGQEAKVYVQLWVNGQQKTGDGGAPAGENGYAALTVVPEP